MKHTIKFNHNPELMEHLRTGASRYLLRLGEGKTALEIAASMYADELGKSGEAAQAVAKAMDGVVNQYCADLGMLGLTDPEHADGLDRETVLRFQERLIDDQLDERIRHEETPKERCMAYYQILVALEAYRITTDGGENARERAAAHVKKSMKFDPSEAECADLEFQLREDVKRAFSETTFLANELSELLATIELTEGENELAYAVASFGESSKDVKLLLCMQAYIDAINGVYGDLNASVDMKALGYAVCASCDMVAAAAHGVKKGDPNLPIFKVLFTVLGVVLGIAIGVFFAASAVSLIFPFLELFLSGMALLIMTLVVFGLAAWANVETWVKIVSKFGARVGTRIDAPIQTLVRAIRDGVDGSKADAPFPESVTAKYCREKSYSPFVSRVSPSSFGSSFSSEKYFDDSDYPDHSAYESDDDQAYDVAPEINPALDKA